ncbi:hypothetical protein G5I_06125 [Acromyrmex echinatior]|uniref:Uncharacterized protein n=1 Tax=Acromyrmex echinatior TaxID=103372 RepID=F4WK79_ACREC|nr:hypothetical protein G5I_06125 [Acromyrmex echinatior]
MDRVKEYIRSKSIERKRIPSLVTRCAKSTTIEEKARHWECPDEKASKSRVAHHHQCHQNISHKDLIRIRYEYPIEGYLIETEPQVRLQNEVEVQIIPSAVSRLCVQIRGFINIATWQTIRAERQWNQEEQFDIWEESDFFLAELFDLRPYESDPKPED